MAESTRDDPNASRDRSLPGFEHVLTFVNQGARVRMEANSSGALDLVTRVLPFGSRIEAASSADAVFSLAVAAGTATDEEPHRLYENSALLQSSPDLEVLLKRLESVLHFTVASHARSSLFVHAGVVGWRDRTILLPGPSMSGKSSLVEALLRAGAHYYSDEYAVIDAEGRVGPYAKPLLLRASGNGQTPAGPRAQGGGVGTRPLPASLIVSTRYARGTRFAPVPCSPSRGLMLLIANTIVVRERPRFALDHLMPVARGATTLEGVRGDADEAAAWLLRFADMEREDGRLSNAR